MTRGFGKSGEKGSIPPAIVEGAGRIGRTLKVLRKASRPTSSKSRDKCVQPKVTFYAGPWITQPDLAVDGFCPLNGSQFVGLIACPFQEGVVVRAEQYLHRDRRRADDTEFKRISAIVRYESVFLESGNEFRNLVEHVASAVGGCFAKQFCLHPRASPECFDGSG
jgi:hypothetical protein